MGALRSPQPCDAVLAFAVAHHDAACRVCPNGLSALGSGGGVVYRATFGRKTGSICRASVPGPGTWFSARVHLDAEDVMVVPAGLQRPDETMLEAVRDSLRRCRDSVLYL